MNIILRYRDFSVKLKDDEAIYLLKNLKYSIEINIKYLPYMFLLRGFIGKTRPIKHATSLVKRNMLIRNRIHPIMIQSRVLSTRNLFNFHIYKWFSTQTITPIEYMKDIKSRNCKSSDEVKKELEDTNKILESYEEFIDDVDSVSKYMETLIDKMKSMRTPPLSEYIVALNSCIEKTQQLEKFEECWKLAEKLIYNQISFISSENIISIVYYFCKYQKTSKVFWSRFDSKLMADVKLLNNSELLSKLLLALIMDQKNNQELYKLILQKLVELMDKASRIDCFYIAVALARNIIDFETIPTDLYYTLYLNTVQYIDQYNLSELSYFLLLFSAPSVQEHIPKEFWINVVEPQLMQAIEDFKTHRDEIEIAFFLDDFMRCFMSHVVSEKASDKIWEAVSEVIIKDINIINDLTIENLIYSIVRSRRKDEKLWNILVFTTAQKKLVADHKINEFCLLLGLMEYQTFNDELTQQLEENFKKLLQIPKEEVHKDLLGLYANVLCRNKTEKEQKEIWDKVSGD